MKGGIVNYMEERAVPLSGDVVVLTELSEIFDVPNPVLTLHTIQYAEDGVLHPATSSVLRGTNVRKLYELLREYYKEKEGKYFPTGERDIQESERVRH